MHHKQAGRKTAELAPAVSGRARRALPRGLEAPRRALPRDRPLAMAERLGPEPARSRRRSVRSPPARRPMRLVMTLKVRDEADIIEDNLRFHRAMGVDFFVVTDNGSVDGTSEILDRYVSAGLAHVIQEPTSGLRSNEMDWTTRMARIAATRVRRRLGLPQRRRRVLVAAHGDDQGRAGARSRSSTAGWCRPRAEFVARPDGPGSFAERLVVREAPFEPATEGRPSRRSRRGGAAATRTRWRPPGAGTSSRRCAPRGEWCTAGFAAPPRTRTRGAESVPRRSASSGRRRTRSGSSISRCAPSSSSRSARRSCCSHGGFRDTGRFRRLRIAYEQGRLDELYTELVWDDSAVEDGVREGKLVRDDRLARLLPRCPDPLAGTPPGSVGVELDPDALERERAEVELDAMRLMTRTQRFTWSSWSARGSGSTSCTRRTGSCVPSSAEPWAGGS